MAITSYGYPLTIAPGGPWATIHGSAGRRYAAHTVTAWKVSATPGGTRQVNVATGSISGVGVSDFNDAVHTIASLPNPGVATYYCIVARRRWNDDSGGYRTEVGYVTAGTTRAIPTLARTPGTIDEQPLALVRIDPGVSDPAEVVDLRLVGQDSGIVTVYDDLALSDAPVGAKVYNAKTGVLFDHVGTAAGDAAAWRRPSAGRLIGLHTGSFVDLAHSGSYPGGFVRVWGSPSPQSQSQTVANLSIPDPGVVYRVAFEVHAWIGSESDPATRWDFDLMVGSTPVNGFIREVAQAGPNASSSADRRAEWLTLPSSQTFTGAQNASIRARRILGTGYGGLLWDNMKFVAAVYEA